MSATRYREAKKSSSMDWENERYVRVYTRDTIDWVALGWEAQSLFLQLVRKVDRSGIIELGRHGVRGVAGLVGMPTDVVERSIAILTEDGCVEMSGGRLLIPNFMEAQEAKQSDRQRQRESRDKRRAEAMKLSQNVTESHDKSHAVTDGHTLSLQPSLASLAEPSQPKESLSPRDPCASATEQAPTTAPKLPGGYEWLRSFQIAHRNKFERDYGHGEQDARATSKLSDLLDSMPSKERASDWERRREMLAEFFGRTDARTQDAGWSFAFFVQDFRALAIPADKRPKPQERDGRPVKMQAKY